MMPWGDNGNKVFWFKETKAGNQMLVRPDGTHSTIREKCSHFAITHQSHAGWQRAKLLMKEYNIWDATAFACTMDTLIGIKPRREENTVYLFGSCQKAEKGIYPYLNEKEIEECRKNVDAFYADPNIQAAWNSLILHPVCIKVTKKGNRKKFIPTSIASLGDGEDVFINCRFHPVWDLKDKDAIMSLFSLEND